MFTTKVKGNTLTIEVDLSQRQGPSSSGKNMIIATSGGNQPVPGHPNIRLGLNVYTPMKGETAQATA